MALFNRKNRTDVPEEIQEYYQTERRERAGIAWLLAFGTLIVTIVLAAGIFFAGRWAYRKIAGTDNGGTQQVAQNEDQQQEQGVQPEDNSEGNSTEQSEGDQQASEEERQRQEEERRAEEERQAEQERQETEEREQAEQEQQEQEAAEQETAAQPRTGDDSEGRVSSASTSIPNTGPGDTAAIFLGVSVLGYLLHRLALRKD